jgi:hypothetical protein
MTDAPKTLRAPIRLAMPWGDPACTLETGHPAEAGRPDGARAIVTPNHPLAFDDVAASGVDANRNRHILGSDR